MVQRLSDGQLDLCAQDAVDRRHGSYALTAMVAGPIAHAGHCPLAVDSTGLLIEVEDSKRSGRTVVGGPED